MIFIVNVTSSDLLDEVDFKSYVTESDVRLQRLVTCFAIVIMG